jgi:hypothetical protein
LVGPYSEALRQLLEEKYPGKFTNVQISNSQTSIGQKEARAVFLIEFMGQSTIKIILYY